MSTALTINRCGEQNTEENNVVFQIRSM